ncbi:hypothetical protein AJ80_06098 [Polytolypa hystricis UAMH7299]|uniref:DNA ligase D 3'-phosphoesterase domain-containing protein n=1 Tax=Polytolypa hystricis (strain UAMH7299) TaxID=1447883 RepID=A0A2B7XZ86_POLH7|nr:hypothetical protein AJ80_06098 [Polytolypa hystricis UAMH7299]
MKRHQSPDIIENPFVKRENREWAVAVPSTLNAPVSPPRTRQQWSITPPLSSRKDGDDASSRAASETAPLKRRAGPGGSPESKDLARIEAGKVRVDDPASIFVARLRRQTRPEQPTVPRLAHQDWANLYDRHQHPQGHHFVIHQHDHPRAGPHYDLRLQFSESSSLSFAIMYGLPGDSNSRKRNRNAIETRVHNLWNHMIESASLASGSMIIWDTGEYTVLPYYDPKDVVETDHSQSDISDASRASEGLSDNEKLIQAFRQRKIRLRLHGARLPPNYTVSLRLASINEINVKPQGQTRKRRRTDPKPRRLSTPSRSPSPPPNVSSTKSSSSTPFKGHGNSPRPQQPLASMTPSRDTSDNFATHSDSEDDMITRTNAYIGATNSIGSVHQRQWFLSLDKPNSGFERRFDASSGRHLWKRKITQEAEDGSVNLLGFEPFYVRGPDVERSVVTGRLGKDVLNDEGIEGFMGRRFWRPVLD